MQPQSHTSEVLPVSWLPRRDPYAWCCFTAISPLPDELIEIRRLHDNKTIIRRRSDLPPSFALSEARWRPA